MNQLVLIVHVLACVFLIVLILVQRGKGADIGAAFGSGASQTIFGSSGSGSFLMKLTCAIGVLFFVTSLSLGYFAAHGGSTQHKDSFISAQAPAATATKDDTVNKPATAKHVKTSAVTKKQSKRATDK